MKRIVKRVAIGLALFLVLGVSALAVAVVVRENRTFDAPYPEIAASKDPAVIARGRYLVTGPAHCVDCHASPHTARTEEPHLVGGLAFDLPLGTVYARNITPDEQTGIGRYNDKELARALRYGVHPTGRAMLPFMPFADLADDDLTAIISYLRSRPPVENLVPQHDLNFLGRAAKAFLIEPTGPTGTPAAVAPSGSTVERGKYIANSIANCNGCHTNRSMRTGEALGVTFAGGLEIESHSEPGKKFITPNLTPDPATGHITAWTEEQFVARFQSGAVVQSGTPMPWASFGHMSPDDLRALYRYLRTLPPTTKGKAL